MPAPVLQFKRGNAGVAGTVPALRPGEPALSLNNFDFFIGIDTSVANNKFFGSHRYWGREDGTNSLKLKLVDKDGSNYVAIKSPNTLAGNVTYTLPGTQGYNGTVLTNDGSGNLTWGSGSNNAIFSGITTFSDTTDNTLGNADTGAVQIDGGLGVNKNVTVGGNLNVQGYSEFVGVVTFRGGTINIGDSNTDNVNVAGEFVSNLTPNDDNTYDIGIGTQRWRNAEFAGVVTATTFSGNASSADQVKTVTASNNAANYYVTFVDSHNGSATNEIVYTDDGIYYNPGTNTFTTQYGHFTGDVTVDGAINVGSITGTASTATRATTVDTTSTSTNSNYFLVFTDNATSTTGATMRVDAGVYYNPSSNYLYSNLFVGDVAAGTIKAADTTTALTLYNTTGNVKTNGDLLVGSGYLASPNGTRTMYLYDTSGDVAFQGKVVANNYRSGSNASNTLTFDDLDATFARNLYVTGITTVGSNLIVTGDVRINGNDIQASDGATNISLTSNTLTAFAGDIKVGGNDIQASDGATNITMTSNTLTEVKGDLQVTGNHIKSSTGATAITLSANDVQVADDLTVGGNLYVNGNTTQVNTSQITVEDRTIELGVVDGAAPSTTTTWDLGVLFNYYDGSAKKSAVVWEQGDARFKLGSVISDGGGTGNSNPQITFSSYAALEISDLWINNSCTGGSAQVIGCVGSELQLQNITVDAGTF